MKETYVYFEKFWKNEKYRFFSFHYFRSFLHKLFHLRNQEPEMMIFFCFTTFR